MHYERLVLVILSLMAVVAGTYLSFRSGNYGYIFAFASLPFAVLLIGKTRLLFILVLLSFNSGLRIPFLPGQLELFHVLALALGGLLFLSRIINKEPNYFPPTLRYSIIGLALILIFTMWIRGTGFRMLGDYKWGGVRYLTLFITLFMMFHSCAIRLTTKQWVFAIIGMQLMAFLPFFAELLFLLSKGTIVGHYYFFKFQGSTGFAFDAFANEQQHGRFQQGGAAAVGVLILAFIITPFKGKGRLIYLACGLLAFLLIGLSGHRMGYVLNTMFILLYGFIASRGARLPFLIIAGITGVILVLSVIGFGHHLPYSYQRALSWIPFTELDRVAEIDAFSTTLWRIQVWSDALHEIPDYLWIGKGFAYDVQTLDALRLNPGDYLRLWAPVSVSYHSGPLSFIIGLGLLGLIVGSILLIYPAVRHLKLITYDWENRWLYRLHLVITVRYVTMVISYYLIYGDVFISVPKLMLHIAILEGLLLTDKELKKQKTQVEEDPEAGKPTKIKHLRA